MAIRHALVLLPVLVLIGCGDDESGVTVPDVVGEGRGHAISELKEAGLEVKSRTGGGPFESCAFADCVVSGQSPDGGTEVEPKSTVKLTVQED